MNCFQTLFWSTCLLSLFGCSGGAGGVGSSPSNSVISASVVETAKLQEALKDNPDYKIYDSEITLLQNEGVITDADKAQLQMIK